MHICFRTAISNVDIPLLPSLSPLTREEPILSLTARMHRAALHVAEKERALAIKYIFQTERMCGGPVVAPEFAEARWWLESTTKPKAHGAAQALQLVQRVLNCCLGTEYRLLKRKVTRVLRAIRNVVMLYCRASSERLLDRADFLKQVHEAFHGALDKRVQDQILNAYTKNRDNRNYGFKSNNTAHVLRTQRRRPARAKQRKCLHGMDTCATCESDVHLSDVSSSDEDVIAFISVWEACAWHGIGPSLLVPMEEVDTVVIGTNGMHVVETAMPLPLSTFRAAVPDRESFSFWEQQVETTMFRSIDLTQLEWL